MQGNTLNEEQRKGLQTCLLMNEAQFDLKTVQAYASEQNPDHFSVYLKTDRKRVEEFYESRYI